MSDTSIAAIDDDTINMNNGNNNSSSTSTSTDINMGMMLDDNNNNDIDKEVQSISPPIDNDASSDEHDANYVPDVPESNDTDDFMLFLNDVASQPINRQQRRQLVTQEVQYTDVEDSIIS